MSVWGLRCGFRVRGWRKCYASESIQIQKYFKGPLKGVFYRLFLFLSIKCKAWIFIENLPVFPQDEGE